MRSLANTKFQVYIFNFPDFSRFSRRLFKFPEFSRFSRSVDTMLDQGVSYNSQANHVALHGVDIRLFIFHSVLVSHFLRYIVGQLIVCVNFVIFLTPDMVSKTMSDMVSCYPSNDCSMPCRPSGIVFNAMSGIKNMTKFTHAINCPTSANEAILNETLSIVCETLSIFKSQMNLWSL